MRIARRRRHRGPGRRPSPIACVSPTWRSAASAGGDLASTASSRLPARSHGQATVHDVPRRASHSPTPSGRRRAVAAAPEADAARRRRRLPSRPLRSSASLWDLTIFLRDVRPTGQVRRRARRSPCDHSWMTNRRASALRRRALDGGCSRRGEVESEYRRRRRVPSREQCRAPAWTPDLGAVRAHGAGRRVGHGSDRRPGLRAARTPPPACRWRPPTRSSSACAPPSSRPGATGFGHFAGLFPLDERPLPRRVDRRRRLEADARTAAPAGCAGAGWTSPRTASTTSLCSGADPLFFLDYVAAAHIELEQVAELVEGAAEVCRDAGVLLIGGETAELPGVYREEELDFAGTCVGIVDRDDVIDGSRCAPGDMRDRLPVERHPHERLLARALDRRRRRLRRRPAARAAQVFTSSEVRALRATADVKALAHVTGGGMLGNLSRVLPGRRHAQIDWDVVGAAAGLPLARRARRGRGRGAASLQPRDRALRGRPRGAERRTRDRRARVIGVLVSGERHEPAGAARRRPSRRRGREQPARRARARAGVASRDRRLRARRTIATARRATMRHGRLAAGAGRRARRPRRLHAHPHAAVPRSLPGARS